MPDAGVAVLGAADWGNGAAIGIWGIRCGSDTPGAICLRSDANDGDDGEAVADAAQGAPVDAGIGGLAVLVAASAELCLSMPS